MSEKTIALLLVVLCLSACSRIGDDAPTMDMGAKLAQLKPHELFTYGGACEEFIGAYPVKDGTDGYRVLMRNVLGTKKRLAHITSVYVNDPSLITFMGISARNCVEGARGYWIYVPPTGK